MNNIEPDYVNMIICGCDIITVTTAVMLFDVIFKNVRTQLTD